MRDEAEALDDLFPIGVYAVRGTSVLTEVVLLDPKPPKIDRLEVLRRIRADERKKSCPSLAGPP